MTSANNKKKSPINRKSIENLKKKMPQTFQLLHRNCSMGSPSLGLLYLVCIMNTGNLNVCICYMEGLISLLFLGLCDRHPLLREYNMPMAGKCATKHRACLETLIFTTKEGSNKQNKPPCLTKKKTTCRLKQALQYLYDD